MTNSIRQDFHTDISSLIANEIQYQKSNYFYFLGRVDPWANGTDDDVAPTSMQDDTDFEDNQIRSNMLFVRRILPNDVSLVAKRNNWVSNTVYDSYDHTKSMLDKPFFCITDTDMVYKCLDNAGGVVSTVKPTGSSFSVIRTSDGYLWKYMYTVPSFKRKRFTSLLHIPVQKSITDSFYNKGSVDDVAIIDGGVGYTDELLTNIVVSGTTTGSGATGTLSVDGFGAVTSITVTSGGTGYTHGIAAQISSSFGTGVVLTPVIVDGVLTSVTVVAGGVGYVGTDTIAFTVGGAIVVPSISSVTGSIVSVNIINSGVGYEVPPTLDIVTATTGSGKYGNPTAILSPIIFEGKIVRVNIVDEGINYPIDNSTSLTVFGDGSNAKFSPVVYNGEIIDIVVDNAGTGYTSMKILVSGSGTGAILNPIITPSNFLSDQSIVEQSTIEGAIYSIPVTVNGTNYSVGTTAVVSGDGSGCTATPIIFNGTITHVVVNTYGSGYSFANVSFIDTNRIDGVSTDAQAYAVISPNKGHGYDAVSELFGNTIVINTSLRNEPIINDLLQDYRQYGIIKNPTNITSGKRSYDLSSVLAYNVTLESVVGLVVDEILLNDNAKFRVIAIDGNSVMLQRLGIKNVSPSGTLVSEISAIRTYEVSAINTYPTVNKYSGKLLYLANEQPFSFSEDQGISIKTFLKF